MCATIQGLTKIGLDLQLDPLAARDAPHIALDVTLLQQCGQRRDPTRGPIRPSPLLQALNACVGPQERFVENQPQDAAEFLATLLAQLAVEPGFLVEHEEVGLCQLCGNNYAQPYVQSQLLFCRVPQQPQPVDVGMLVEATRQDPLQPGLMCHNPMCAGRGAPIPPTLVPAPGHALLLHLQRNQGLLAGKVLTPLGPIPANQPEWPGLHLQAALGHREHGAHWVAWVQVQGVWWRVDSAPMAIHQEDPFWAQTQPFQPRDRLGGFTIDVLFFGE